MKTFDSIKQAAERRLSNLERRLTLGIDTLSVDEVMDMDEEIENLEQMLGK